MQLNAAMADRPTCVAVVEELNICIKQSKREDKKYAMKTFVDELNRVFDSPVRADVFRMLNHLTRARGCLKAHVRDHAKLEMLDHYMRLLGDAPNMPAFPELDSEHEPRFLPRQALELGPTLVLYTDGSFFESPGLAGWSFVDVANNIARCGNIPQPEVFMTPDTRMTKAEFHCAFAEAFAILEGLRAYRDHNVCFYVDSQSTIDTFNALNYLQQSDFREVPFAHVWKEIFLLSRGRVVHCEKVAAHAEVEYNEQADVLAKFGAHLPTRGARTIRCPEGAWWGSLNRSFALSAGTSSPMLIRLWNDEIRTWDFKAGLTLLPVRHTQLLIPMAANDEAPTRHEVKHAISLLSNVTPGADGIVMQMCKEEGVFEDLFNLIVEIWESGDVPTDWQRSIMVSLKKNPYQDLGPDNCRGICLTSIPSRILTRIILERGAGAGIHREQMGFRRSQGAPQAQMIVRQAIRAANLDKTPLILTFVDLVKAFDQLDRSKLAEVLRRYGYGKNAIRLMQAMWDSEVALKYPDGTFSKAFKTKVGTKQGDVCSPFIFNLYMDLAVRDIISKLSGITFMGAAGQDLLKLIMYADDIVLFAESEEAASVNLALLEEALRPTGLKVNVGKTKTLHAASVASPRQDTKVGYSNRLLKTGKHKNQHPGAARTSISYVQREGNMYGRLEMQMAQETARCPHEQCPFVATGGSVRSMNCLDNHLRQRHNIKKVDIHMSPAVVSAPSDPDPNLRLDVAPSVARRPEGYVSWVHLNGWYLERVLCFRYLGALISEDGALSYEIRNRIAAAQAAFHKLPRDLWASEDMPLYVKWELYKSLVLTRLLYGAEAWTPTETDVSTLEATYMKHLRVLTGLSTVFEDSVDGVGTFTTPARRRITEIMNEPRIEDILRTYRLRLYGQVKRAGPFSFLHQWAYLEPINTESAPRGQKREAWHRLVSADLYAKNLQDTTPCFNRRQWKEEIAYSPRGPKRVQLEYGAWMA